MATIFNEMEGSGGATREPYARIEDWLKTLSRSDVDRALREAEAIFRRQGITFAVYGDNQASERLIPFDIIPRVFAAAEWRKLSAGIEQRVRALNAFIHDLYHRQEILRAGRIPHEFIIQNEAFVPEMVGVMPARGIYAHIIGIDIVRVAENEFYVLEDNCRTPSGVSYMLEDREAMMYLFPDLFAQQRVAPVENYPAMLRQTLESVAPPACKGEPTVVILTPGIHNSAFFEHAFLADEMGVELCEGGDLFVEDGYLYMRTTQEPKRVDVVYRRIDDAYLDPLTFRPRLGDRRSRHLRSLPRGPRDAGQRAGHRHRRRQVDLHLHSRSHRVLHRREAAAEERADLALRRPQAAVLCARPPARTGGEGSAWLRRLRHAGRAHLLQEGDRGVPRAGSRRGRRTTSRSPRWRFPPCRPSPIPAWRRAMSTSGPSCCRATRCAITPGGLTRVALKKGSLVVNSSQGGGTKDTWVLED